jgi:putative sigma-54 modulation protein
MTYKYTFKHMEALESIETFAAQKVEKLERYSLHKDVKIHFIFETSKKKHKCEILLDAGSHHHTAVAIEDDMYVAIDKAIERMETQLYKDKDKVKDHHHQLRRNEAVASLETSYKDIASLETFDMVKKAN